MGGKATTRKILQVRLWWPTLHKDSKEYSKSCNVCQKVGKPSQWDELPLNLIHRMQIFKKWAIEFIGPITPPERHSRTRYIITATEYLTRWVEATPFRDCTVDIAVGFTFENIILRFGCSKSLKSDQGTHFINETIEDLLKNFMIQHKKSSPYHPQTNGTVEAFNKILEKGLKNIISANRDDWNERIPTTLWVYRTTVKRLHKKTSFKLVYRKEAVMPVEFIIPSIFKSEAMRMTENTTLRERLSQLMELDESRFLAEFHQSVEQRRRKSWYNRNIRKKTFKVGDQVLLYVNKFHKLPRKL